MFPIRDNIPSRRVPFVNYALVIANAVLFLFELSLGPWVEPFIYQYGLVPAQWHPRTLVTSMFLHGGWMHLISNIWTLYIFGDNVEDRLGHIRYLAFYFSSGIAASLLHLLTNWGSPLPTIGASGAIAGVMGAYFVLFPHARVLTLVPVFIFLQTIEIPAFVYLGFWFLSQLYTGVFSLGASFGGVAWWAHIGGFAAGIYLVWSLRLRRY